MNVLQIMDYAAPYKGNFIPSVQNLGSHIKQEGGRLIYLFPITAQKIGWSEELKRDGETVYFIDNSFFSKRIKYSNIKKLMQIIKKENVSIIHTYFVAYNYTIALMNWCFIPKIKIVGNFMNEFSPPKNIYYRFKVFITKLTFDTIVASSSAVKQSVLNAGINAKKVVTIYNALDFKHLQTNDVLNLKDDDSQKIILMFGWTFYRKGVDIAVKAVKRLIEGRKDIKLVIAMAGGQEIIKTEIINLLGTVPEWITLLGPDTDVAKYYNSADIFLSSSREEGFTYSVLEAAYCNPMIIISEIGGHPIDIPHVGKFKSEKSDKLKEVIEEMLIKTPKERDQMKSTQKEYVVKNYNIDEWSKDIIKVYSTI